MARYGYELFAKLKDEKIYHYMGKYSTKTSAEKTQRFLRKKGLQTRKARVIVCR